ncbi:hypothetical protein NM688_g9411 [Phlebia brevispora]|uniref:Uncharacterized protein n=1 Tax=Phlebia brevispora TaxID=194682 RepID=A0ACC1RK67_9APHY|nr:hypothetical protein NM688_g9411 [Phlebia brevispora]
MDRVEVPLCALRIFGYSAHDVVGTDNNDWEAFVRRRVYRISVPILVNDGEVRTLRDSRLLCALRQNYDVLDRALRVALQRLQNRLRLLYIRDEDKSGVVRRTEDVK